MPKTSHYISIPGLKIDRRSKAPAYKQVYESLRKAILSQQIRPGQRLPSSRILSEDIGVSRNIILLAYEQLALEGYITGAVGNGSFVATNIESTIESTPKKVTKDKSRQIRTKDGMGTDAIRFNYPWAESYLDRVTEKTERVPFRSALPAFDHFPYKNWVKCAQEVYRGFEFVDLGYGNTQGYLPLREAIASYLRLHRAVNCEADQIIVTNGTQQALRLIADLLVRKGQQCWLEDPGYPHAKAAFMHAGAKPCYIPVTKYGINLDWAKAHYPKASLAIITPSHQYPLGGGLPVAKRLQLLNWAARNGMWIIEDDYDSEFRYVSKPIPSLQGLDQYKRVLYVGTFSKVLFPGLRIGYIVLPDPQMVKAFVYAKAFADRQNSITDQMILSNFLNSGHFTMHLRKMRVLYKKRQDFLIALIDQHGRGIMKAERQNSGMHLVAWLRPDMDDKAIAISLKEAGIAALPLSIYYSEFRARPGLILGYTGFDEPTLKEGVLKMMAVIKNRQP